jgi:hypothetical protein
MIASILWIIGTCSLAIKRFRVRHWSVRDARVMTTEYENGATGWHIVTVYYEYRIDGARWDSWQTRPFIAESSAKDHVKALPENAPLKARVKPSDPAVAVLIKDPAC